MSRRAAERLAWALHRRAGIPPRIVRDGRQWAAYLDNDTLPDQVDIVFKFCERLCARLGPQSRYRIIARYGDAFGLPVFNLDPGAKYKTAEIEFRPYS